MTTACSIQIGSPPAADFKTPKAEEEWTELDDAWSTRAAEAQQPDLDPAAAAEEEGEFKPDLYLLLDGILPSTIEDWETELQKAGPIINDLFIGQVTKVRLRQSSLPVKEEPRSAVFVGPVEEGSLDGYGAVADNVQQQQQNPHTFYQLCPQHTVSHQPHHLEPSTHGSRTNFSTAAGTISSIATTSTYPHSRHYHSTFQHEKATSSISALYSLQSTSTRQPAREPISAFDDELHFSEIRQQRTNSSSGTFAPGQYLPSQQPHYHEAVPIIGQEPVFDPPALESSSLENDDDSTALWQGIDNVQLFVMSSPSASSLSVSSSSASPSSSRSQEEILEEIQRECAEIEERHSSVSPPASQSPSTSQHRRTQHNSQSRRNHSHSGTPTIKSRPRSSRSTNSASPSATSDRKKELNRIAAIKYRERRRQERESATGELTQLEARNRELLADYASVEAEIKYLKRLIDEINARAASS